MYAHVEVVVDHEWPMAGLLGGPGPLGLGQLEPGTVGNFVAGKVPADHARVLAAAQAVQQILE